MIELSDTIQEALDLAEGSVGTTARAVDVLTKVKGLFSNPKTAIEADVALAMAELTDALADAKLANSNLKTKLHEVLEAQRKADKVNNVLARYTLTTTKGGATVYSFTPEDGDPEPPHLICPQCYDDGKRSILQGQSHKECTRCKAAFRIEPTKATERAVRGMY